MFPSESYKYQALNLALEFSVCLFVCLVWAFEFPPYPRSFPSQVPPPLLISTKESLGKEMTKQRNEGGIQDACCICLEDFSPGRASTETSCNHQYHLQCIIEWCQRSSNCPTCRQQVRLKEADSQDLLEAVEHEKRMKAQALRNATAQITPAELDWASRRAAEEDQVQEQLRQYMINMGRRYQFAPVTASSSNSDAESSAADPASSDSLTAQFSSISTRYRDSILRSTRGWKERLLCRSNSMGS